MNQLTNQELITELKRRIQNGTLQANIKVEQFKKETKSLLSYLDSKSLLLLIGLSAGFALLTYYILQITTISPTKGSLEFSDQESKIT